MAGDSFSCDSDSPLGGPLNPFVDPNGIVNAGGWQYTGADDYPSDLTTPYFQFEGYAGGAHFDADDNLCGARKPPNFVNVDGSYSPGIDMKVTCMDRTDNSVFDPQWLPFTEMTNSMRVCGDCFSPDGKVSFEGAFTFAGTVHLANMIGNCVVTGAFTLGGCDTNVECVP